MLDFNKNRAKSDIIILKRKANKTLKNISKRFKLKNNEKTTLFIIEITFNNSNRVIIEKISNNSNNAIIEIIFNNSNRAIIEKTSNNRDTIEKMFNNFDRVIVEITFNNFNRAKYFILTKLSTFTIEKF